MQKIARLECSNTNLCVCVCVCVFVSTAVSFMRHSASAFGFAVSFRPRSLHLHGSISHNFGLSDLLMSLGTQLLLARVVSTVTEQKGRAETTAQVYRREKIRRHGRRATIIRALIKHCQPYSAGLVSVTFDISADF